MLGAATAEGTERRARRPPLLKCMVSAAVLGFVVPWVIVVGGIALAYTGDVVSGRL
jgi:hypothetical protein